MKILELHVKKKYFDQIKSGEKTEEYRLSKPFWYSRLHQKTFDVVIILLGYPPKSKTSPENCLCFPFNGITMKTIQHDEFGPAPVNVYAIALRR